ncbi:amidohydrolase family protein [Leptospira sp. GIMC2001]|uniref:amidohydrolase family protein n=1 Tax=Leptospira sp. GIMC2001 TaxID=1513297 RepID=UPI00234B6E5C|nr:amidohydrolase family protein [Leptospira sp. GIMC2001]WCL50549.1 amidohydrolase family protein [Leptospira sp. GIMC2001]
MEWEIQNAEIVGVDGARKVDIHISNAIIKSLDSLDPSSDCPVLDAEGLYIYPGLINAHDHLIGSYSPKVGGAKKYLSWLSWDNELKTSLVFSERQTLEISDLYMLGAYKNILGGTTTVMDHAPLFLNRPFIDNLPIKLVKDYTLSHNVGDYSLGWGDGPALEYQTATKKNIPYVTHIGEGTDEDSASSLNFLDKNGALGKNSVLVHGIPFQSKDLIKIKQAQANVVWCPTSNLFLYGKTSPIRDMIQSGIPVSLGTDLALAGSNNILEEMKAASNYYSEQYSEGLAPLEIFKMVTENPAKAFGLSDQIGSIQKGKKADLLILKKNHPDPYVNLLHANSSDIVLLVCDGKPLYGDSRFENLMKDLQVNGEMIKIGNAEQDQKFLVGTPKKLLKSIRMALGYKKDLAFLPIIE